jgi:hypothetical protein
MNVDGEWQAQPPVWEAIHIKGTFDITTNPECTNNLQRYIDMSDDDESFGRVLDETQFLEFCKYST